MQLIYLMFFIALALFGCKQNSTEPFGIEHTTLPESAEVQVPSIIMSVGIESGGMSLSWSVCDGARVYELEELNSGTWQLNTW